MLPCSGRWNDPCARTMALQETSFWPIICGLTIGLSPEVESPELCMSFLFPWGWSVAQRHVGSRNGGQIEHWWRIKLYKQKAWGVPRRKASERGTEGISEKGGLQLKIEWHPDGCRREDGNQGQQSDVSRSWRCTRISQGGPGWSKQCGLGCTTKDLEH